MKKTLVLFLALSSWIYGSGQVPNPCDVSYVYEMQNNHMIDFDDISTGSGPKIIDYLWNFGDGSTSSLSDPRHVFMIPGNYLVCLTITTEDSCVSTFCDTISIGFQPNDTNSYVSISGHVFAGDHYLPAGIALLINRINNNYVASAYTPIVNGSYSFPLVPQGKFMVYCIPYFSLNTLYYPVYFPTYYGDALHWQDAVDITVGGTAQVCDVYLEASTKIIHGPDVIEGSLQVADQQLFEYFVYWGNWFGNITGSINFDIAPNIPVLLLDKDNNPVRFAISDEKGMFAFGELPLSQFKVYPEKAGMETNPATINLQSLTSSTAQTSLILGTGEIYVSSPMVQIDTESDDFYAYPVPAGETITLVYHAQSNGAGGIIITDVCGKILRVENTNLTTGNNTFVLSTGMLTPGVYQITVSESNGNIRTLSVIR